MREQERKKLLKVGIHATHACPGCRMLMFVCAQVEDGANAPKLSGYNRYGDKRAPRSAGKEAKVGDTQHLNSTTKL
jgi:hypothetical protein